jgi:hypothetical protein
MPLGNTVNNIRHQAMYLSGDTPERREWLNEIGFVWDELERRWETAKIALTTYKEVHGNLEVPRASTVPSSAPWAEETWGMPLGSSVNHIRVKGMYLSGDKPERREWLNEVGFRWCGSSMSECE